MPSSRDAKINSKIHNLRYFINERTSIVIIEENIFLINNKKIEDLIDSELINNKFYLIYLLNKYGFYEQTSDTIFYNRLFLVKLKFNIDLFYL
jgi:uncharacterized Zn-finger protein